MINLELYRIFVIVANELNITRASEKLNISQPAVTKHINKLESLLNLKLFERSNKGLKLTSEGNRLYFKIKDSIDLINSVEEELQENKIIRLGTTNTILSKIFSRAITKFYNLYPNEVIDIQMYEIEEMLDKLNNNSLDIVLSKKVDYFKFENLKFISLGELHNAFITKKGSKYANKVFSKDDLKHQIIYINNPKKNPVSTRILKELFNIEDFKYQKNFIHINTGGLVEIIKQEEKIGFITKEFIKEELYQNKIEIIKTDFEIETTEYGIYYNKNNHFKALDNLIEIIES